MKDWKTLMAFPALASLALAIGVLTSPHLPAAASPQEVRTFTGILSGWQLDTDGTIYLRVRGSGESMDEEWFRTPSDKHDNARNFEELLAESVLANPPDDERTITIRAKHERALDGKSPEHAIPLMSVSRP